ncbi:MAG: hypothetical protein ACTSXP_17735, partial [Promethearchaeota archaeon]
MSSKKIHHYIKEMTHGKGFFIYYLLLSGGFFCLLILSIIIFPSDYSILDDTISTLGSRKSNPSGWILFISAMIYLSLMLVPFFLAVTLELGAINKYLAFFEFSFGIIACIGLIIIGIFQEETTTIKIHHIGAYLALGGFFLSSIFKWINLDKYIRGFPKKGKARTFMLFRAGLVLFVFAAGGLITQVVLDTTTNAISYSGYRDLPVIGKLLGFPFWEWMFFFLLIVEKTTTALIFSFGP